MNQGEHQQSQEFPPSIYEGMILEHINSQVSGDEFGGIPSKHFSGMIKVSPTKSTLKQQSNAGGTGEFAIEFLLTNEASEFRRSWHTSLSWEKESSAVWE